MKFILLPLQFFATFCFWLTHFLPLYLLGFVVVPLGLLFCRRESEHLPSVFWPWDNVTGINGTLGGNNPIWPQICGSARATRTFRNRFVWLAWRNPVSNWGRYVLGRIVHKPVKILRGDTDVGDGFGCHPGLMIARSGILWEVFGVWKYAQSKCVRIRFGWKLTKVKHVGELASFVLTIIPVKHYRGI